ncbi:MAG: dTDP-4-dehydrorhamnose reductase [Bryobacterales bacterium]|nr:dTDP-4-dehydrorhamnose reductase [Bryobacterales bacterium]
MTYLGAFESTHIHGSGKDVLETSRHTERWEHDLGLLLASGISELRYPIPWHRIEDRQGEFDFSWIDGPMAYMYDHGMRPIIDPLHHTSFPEWLTDGFCNPQFSEFYLRFLKAVLERYPWVDRCTVFNEPLATTVLCGLMGRWYPYHNSVPAFVRMAVQVSRTICAAMNLVREHNSFIELVRVDTCEYHFAMDEKSESFAAFCNERRFIYDDLTSGRIDSSHSLYPFLTSNGIEKDELQWFRDNPEETDIFGLDYYAPSEMDWRWDRVTKSHALSWPVSTPRGFASAAQDYSTRYGKPLMLTETNVRGSALERVTWLKHMVEQCEILTETGVDLRGFCWFPSIDSTDWDQLCTKCALSVDPQGIWLLDQDRWTRHATELSDVYAGLARGELDSSSIPTYELVAPLDRDLAGHMRLLRNRGDVGMGLVPSLQG